MTKKLEEALKDDSQKLNKMFLQMAVMKWRFMISIIKLKNSNEDFHNESIDTLIGRLMEG